MLEIVYTADYEPNYWRIGFITVAICFVLVSIGLTFIVGKCNKKLLHRKLPDNENTGYDGIFCLVIVTMIFALAALAILTFVVNTLFGVSLRFEIASIGQALSVFWQTEVVQIIRKMIWISLLLALMFAFAIVPVYFWWCLFREIEGGDEHV